MIGFCILLFVFLAVTLSGLVNFIKKLDNSKSLAGSYIIWGLSVFAGVLALLLVLALLKTLVGL